MNKNDNFVLKNSLGMFDLLKGVMMIIVMITHTYGLFEFNVETEFLSELFSQINIFVLLLLFIFKLMAEATMPAFFLISGYGFRKTTFRKCLKKQCKLLLIPFFITMIISTILHFFSYAYLYKSIGGAKNQTLKVFIGGLLGIPQDHDFHGFYIINCGPIWFLLALAIAFLVFNFLINHFEGNMLIVSVFIVTCIGWILSLLGPLPYSLSQGLISVFYIWLGYYAKKHKLFISQIKSGRRTLIASLATLIYIAFISTQSFFDMANDSYALGPVSIVIHGLLGIALIKIFLHLNSLNGFISTCFRRIGRFTLQILCIHSIEMVAIGGYVQYLFYESWVGSPVLRSVIIIVTRITVVIFISFIYVKIKKAILNKLS